MTSPHAALLLILAVTLTQGPHFTASAHEVELPRLEIKLNVTGLRVFLESQYVGKAGLLRAAVESGDRLKIYIVSDNLWAPLALEALGSPLADVILETLQERYGGLPVNYSKHEAVWGIPVTTFYATHEVTIGYVNTSDHGTLRICVDTPMLNETMSNFMEYGDLVAYYGLSKLAIGDIEGAIQAFKHLMSLWDGWGVHDKVVVEREKSTGKAIYDTYKAALLVMLYRALVTAGAGEDVEEYVPVIEEIVEEILPRLQAPYGGMYTEYIVTEEGVAPRPGSDANTETTSIVVIALLSSKPYEIGLLARQRVLERILGYYIPGANMTQANLTGSLGSEYEYRVEGDLGLGEENRGPNVLHGDGFTRLELPVLLAWCAAYWALLRRLLAHVGVPADRAYPDVAV